MDGMTEDQRITLGTMHALAQATLRAKEALQHRKYLEVLADFIPDFQVDIKTADPRDDNSLAKGTTSKGAARRLAARVRGVVLGAAAHQDTTTRELQSLVKFVVNEETQDVAGVEKNARKAFEATREDLERDVVRLAPVDLPSDETDPNTVGDMLRRWGAVRALELNAFVAAFTRDGTHASATRATNKGKDAGALRFSIAVANAALSLAKDAAVDPGLVQDVIRTENALPALLANVIASARE